MFELITKLDELILKQEKVNAIFTAVMVNYFYGDKANSQSEKEADRNLAYDLVGQYEVYRKLLDAAWDISHELEDELQKVSDGFTKEW